MKKSALFIILLTTVSLFGCGGLATKPSATHKSIKVNHVAHKNQETPVSLKNEAVPFSAKKVPLTQVRVLENKPAIRKPIVKMPIEKRKPRHVSAPEPSAPRQVIKLATLITELENLWDRIPYGYQLPTDDNSQIDSLIEEYVGYPPYFQRMSTNARPYLYHIVLEIEKRGMPLEIALLPAIESAFEPLALSHSNAAGLWQFIPATGKYYGLKQDKWYDERRDIIKSTDAALDYLQELHKMFDGNWLQALAAYNCGQGNVINAMKKNQKLGKPTDFWSLELPKETRKYVPRLLALSKIVASPEKYDIKLQPIANKPYFQQVNVGNQIDFSLAAQMAGLSFNEFKRLNPGYRLQVTAPKGPHHILLPIDNVDAFKQRLAKIPAQKLLVGVSKPNKMSAKTQQYYSVQKGDNLWKIAKRYEMTVATLRQLNKLKGDFLQVGQRLRVQRQKHKIRQGDTLWAIAKHYGTTVSLLRKLNNIKGSMLKVGKFLVIPTKVATLQKIGS